MIPRMTTVGTLKNYRYTLNKSGYTMMSAMNTVTTQRLFNSYSEDPALATRCFQLRRSYQRTVSQLTVNNSLSHKYDVAWSAKLTASEDIYALSSDASFASILRSANGADATGRQALGQSLAAKAQDLVQTLNGRYGENYVFSGADTLNVPFTWEPEENPAYIDPDVAETKANDPNLSAADQAKYIAACQYEKNGGGYTNKIADAAKDGNGDPVKNAAYKTSTSYKYVTKDGGLTNNEKEADTVLCYRGVPVDSDDPEDQKKMEYFLSETKYVDIGLGHKEENGTAVSSSVFNCALQGIYYTGGYGTQSVTVTDIDGTTQTVDNVPTNLISVINRLGEILQNCDPNNGNFNSPEDELEARALAQVFEDNVDIYIQRWTELDTQAGFLRDNGELLTDTATSLSQQFMELEDADPAAAITSYMYARYSYDSALKVGNTILSQSLMDYMTF